MLKRIILAPILVALLTSSGCGALRVVEEHELASMVVVKQAAGRYIERADDWQARAARVREVAEKALLASGGEAVELAQIRSAALAAIDFGEMTPADRDLALLLVNAIASEVERRVGVGELVAGELVTVQQVLGWVVDTARAYESAGR